MNARQLLLLALCLLVVVVVAFSVYWWNWGRPQTADLKLATGPAGGTFHSLGYGIGDAIHAFSATTSVEVMESAGSVDNMGDLQSRKVDLAIVQNDTDPQGDVQTLIPLHRGVCHFLVHRDSDISSIYELRGKSVAVGREHSGNLHIVIEVLKHFGVEQNEITMLKDGINECGPDLESGDIDAALIITAITSPTLTALVKRGNVKYVSLGTAGDANEVDGFAVTYPYVEKFTIPRYVYPVHDQRHGLPREAIESFALRSTLVCRSDLPDAVARTIVDAIVSNRAQIMRKHHEARDITEHFKAADVQFPIHHGAMAYYQRQRPSLLERYSEPMAFVLSLFLAVCGMGAAFNKWLNMGKKNRIDKYYERLDALLDEINGPDTTAERLIEIDAELTEMRHDAVRKLVNEELMVDESFQIFQSLLTDCQRQLAFQRTPKT